MGLVLSLGTKTESTVSVIVLFPSITWIDHPSAPTGSVKFGQIRQRACSGGWGIPASTLGERPGGAAETQFLQQQYLHSALTNFQRFT